MTDELTTVHDALEAAQITEPFGKNDDNPKLVQCTFRVGKETKAAVEQICSQHGVTISTWLRKACEGLQADYCGVKQELELPEHVASLEG